MVILLLKSSPKGLSNEHFIKALGEKIILDEWRKSHEMNIKNAAKKKQSVEVPVTGVEGNDPEI
jgi:hypothetical protein